MYNPGRPVAAEPSSTRHQAPAAPAPSGIRTARGGSGGAIHRGVRLLLVLPWAYVHPRPGGGSSTPPRRRAFRSSTMAAVSLRLRRQPSLAGLSCGGGGPLAPSAPPAAQPLPAPSRSTTTRRAAHERQHQRRCHRPHRTGGRGAAAACALDGVCGWVWGIVPQVSVRWEAHSSALAAEQQPPLRASRNRSCGTGRGRDGHQRPRDAACV